MSREAAERRGRRAEALAAWWLRAKGYTILARRAKTTAGEVDIVACRGRLVAFVEVKARGREGDALRAVTPGARRRIGAAAKLLLARWDGRYDAVRYDLMIVRPWRLPSHVEDAWREQR